MSSKLPKYNQEVGGYVVHKSNEGTAITNDGRKGGIFHGKTHQDSGGGIKAVVDNERPILVENGEVIINKVASKKYWKELSKINQSAGNGVAIGPPQGAEDDGGEFGEGGTANKIHFNPNHLPKKYIIEFAEKIKKDHPKIWAMAGNTYGNTAYENLKRVSDRGYWLNDEDWMYIKWRGYVARHKQDYQINGIIAMLKWGDHIEKGFNYMKKQIEAEIRKGSKRKPRTNKEYSKGGGLKSGKISANIIHIEKRVEYYDNGNLINPTLNEKLNWTIYGMPDNIEKREQTFETIIDKVSGNTKKEIDSKINTNIANGEYNYLGWNPDLQVRFAEGGNIEYGMLDNETMENWKDLQQNYNYETDAFATGGNINGVQSQLSRIYKAEQCTDINDVMYAIEELKALIKRFPDSMQAHRRMSRLLNKKIELQNIVDFADGNRYAKGSTIKSDAVKKRSLMSMANLVVADWRGEKINDWYTKTYPTDELGEEINEITFEDLWNSTNTDNIYNVIGVGDSLIRERLFEHLSEIYGVEYNDVYDRLFGSKKYAHGGNIGDFSEDEILSIQKKVEKSGQKVAISKEEIDASNYSDSTKTTFQGIEPNFCKEILEQYSSWRRKKNKPEYIVTSKYGKLKINYESEKKNAFFQNRSLSYYFVSENNDFVIRISDHWSKSNYPKSNKLNCGNISTCFWDNYGERFSYRMPAQSYNSEMIGGLAYFRDFHKI